MPPEDDDLEEDEPIDEPPPARQPDRSGSNKPRPRRDRPAPLGVAGPPQFDRKSNEAPDVWNEIIEWGKDNGLGARDVSIGVKRMWPPSPSGEATYIGRSFGGEMVQGSNDTTPGAALLDHLIRWKHLSTTEDASSYDVIFGRRGTGKQLAVGRVSFPPGAECRAALEASAASDRASNISPSGFGGGAPPPAPAWPGGGNYPLPQGYYPPPQPARMDQSIMQELSYMRGALQEALAAAREGRAPNIAPPPPGVSAPGGASPISEEVIANRVTANVLAALQGAGIMPNVGVAPAAAAPPPPPAPTSLAGRIEKMIGSVTETFLDQLSANVGKTIKSSMGMGAPSEVEDETASTAAPIQPAAEDVGLPWRVSEVGSAYADGRKVMVARDPKTGDIDWTGTAMANPFIAEKAVDIVQGVGNAVKDYVTKAMGNASAGTLGRPQAPQVPPQQMPAQVVSEIPRGAVDASPLPNGSGSTPWQAP